MNIEDIASKEDSPYVLEIIKRLGIEPLFYLTAEEINTIVEAIKDIKSGSGSDVNLDGFVKQLKYNEENHTLQFQLEGDNTDRVVNLIPREIPEKLNDLTDELTTVLRFVEQPLQESEKQTARNNISALDVKMSGLSGGLTASEKSVIQDKLGIEDTDLTGLLANPTYDSDTHIFTMDVIGGSQFQIDFPIEALITNVDLDDDNNLVITFEDGSSVLVPLNTLLVGVVKTVNGKNPNSQGVVTINIADIPDLQDELDNKADVSDIPNDYLPLSGGTMTGNINWNSINIGLTYNDTNRLRFSDSITVLSSNQTGTGFGIYLRPRGDNTSVGQVAIGGDGQINTQNHGNSSQWFEAYGWGDYSSDKNLWKYVRILTANDNLNDLRDIGIYQTSATASATPANNYPVQAAGILRVYSSGTMTTTHIIQEYTRYNGNRTVFKRYYYNGTWSSWSEFWDSDSFNPAQYVQQSALNTQLNNYATKSGTQTFTGQNTFAVAPIVPNGTLNGHTVNLGQLNNAIANKANTDGSNTTGGTWNIDALANNDVGNYVSNRVFSNATIGIPSTNALGSATGVLLMGHGSPIAIAENENTDWDGYLYRAGTPKPGYPGNQQKGNYLIESKHRFRLHTITAPDSTSGDVGFLQINPFNAIEHNYFRVTISSVKFLNITIKEPYNDEITDSAINRNAIGQKCTVAVSGGLTGVKFTNVAGMILTSYWNKGVFEFYWTGTGWIFGGYSPIEP